MDENLYPQLPTGIYTCIIDEINVGVDAKNRKVVTWEMAVTGGAHDGACFQKRYYLVSDNVRAYLEKDLAMLGLTVKSSKELMKARDQAADKLVHIEVKYNDEGYPVYYLKGVVKESGPQKAESAAFDW